MNLPETLLSQLVNFLTSFPNIQDKDVQRALVFNAGLDTCLQSQIQFGGPAAQFVPLLVSILLEYGKLDDGQYALVALLMTVKNSVGQDKKTHCDILIKELTDAIKGQSQFPSVISNPSTQASPISVTSSNIEQRGDVLIFDIEGTLLRPHDTFRSNRGNEILEILQGLVESNYKIVLITGNDYKLQYDRILLPLIEQNIAQSVFCFSDGGSRAFEFNGNDFVELQDYSRENLFTETEAQTIEDVFNSLLIEFITQYRVLLLPKIEYYERTLDYIDLLIAPICPSFRNDRAKFENFIQDIEDIYRNQTEMNIASIQVFADPTLSGVVIKIHSRQPELDAFMLQGMIFRNILNQKKYAELSKPEVEKRGGDVICQIALKPFNDNPLRRQFRKKLEDKFKEVEYDKFSILTGGKTTIDIQRKGVNKAKAIRYLINQKRYSPQHMIYFGDEFFEFGNDYPVLTMDKEERPNLIINVGRTHDTHKTGGRGMISDCGGAEGTRNFLELLLFKAK